MWIDTEGFEPYVLQGAEHILKCASVPLFMEFNPFTYEKYEIFDQFINFLDKFYTKYIEIPDFLKGITEPRAILDLKNYKNIDRDIIFDIFLIK